MVRVQQRNWRWQVASTGTQRDTEESSFDSVFERLQPVTPKKDCVLMVAANANAFHVVTYNILAKSLATNTIPWVMTVSPNIRKRIEHHSSENFTEWVNTVLKPEYLAHFHKNFESGDYASMRGFWGARQCGGPQDIPKELSGLTWVGQDQVSYGEKNVVATTLRGMARQSLPSELFCEFFEEVQSTEEEIFSWLGNAEFHGRGPRIFAKATEQKPDIVALQEYDCHSSVADYRKGGGSETFANAMAAIGYDGAFFKDPLRGRDPPSGLGLFWQRDVFQPFSASSGSSSGIQVLECGDEASGGSIFNLDMEEYWHRKMGPADAPPSLMPAADRRNAALARLRHLPSGRSVVVCAAHLMTTSRDGKTNWYPGEVRAGEIATLRKLLESKCKAEDAVLLLGDFNTDAKEVGTIFGGSVSCSDKNVLAKTNFDTGFDPHTTTFAWGPHQLKEAFTEVHQWGKGVGAGKNCTSHNADRVEWIDFVWHSANLQPIERCDLTTPEAPIPDGEHPSDHLPVRAAFEFV